MNKSITAIIKPTHACNLACKYCYVEKGAEQGRMDAKTLDNMVRQLMALHSKDRVHFIWHGGEPLLMGTDFYKEAYDIQQKYRGDKKVDNGMQSNATLVDDSVLDFCEQYEFNIGSSMDGPKEIHDLTRVYHAKDGVQRGSFDDVWRGVQAIRKRNEEIRKKTPKDKKPVHLGGGVITILNRFNIGRLNEIYDFFKQNNMSIKINPIMKSGRAADNYEELGINSREYGRALIKLFDRWFNEKERGIDVDPLSTILGNLMTGHPVSCNFGESCRNGFVSIGPNGDVYPCGRFDGIKEYWLGNINTSSLPDILESRTHKVMAERNAQTVKGCSKCDYSKICNAGCMHNAYMQKGNIGDKDYYCSSYKILFKHLGTVLRKELDRAVATPEEVEKYKLELAARNECKSEVCDAK